MTDFHIFSYTSTYDIPTPFANSLGTRLPLSGGASRYRPLYPPLKEVYALIIPLLTGINVVPVNVYVMVPVRPRLLMPEPQSMTWNEKHQTSSQ